MAVRPHSKEYAPLAGFSLLEMLLVITIIGVMAGMAVLSLSGNSARLLEAEAERIQHIMQLAADEAVFENTEIGLMLGTHSYVFLRYDANTREWRSLGNKPFSPYAFPYGITLSLTQGSQNISLPDTLPADKFRPSLVFFSSGEMTPFTLALTSPQARAPAVILADGISPIAIQGEQTP